VRLIDLTYIELGIHEELVAYVADQQDYYQQEGVHVALRDGRAWDRERLRRTATIGRCSGCSPATPTRRPES
jgi:NitT/TauT family transport system substrate-binding protein